MFAQVTVPKPMQAPSANSRRYSAVLHAYDVSCRLRNGHITTMTTIATNSCVAIGNCAQVYGDQMVGVKVKTL